ncbi:MAG: hypothetical protein ABDH21_04225 [bacterium]
MSEIQYIREVIAEFSSLLKQRDIEYMDYEYIFPATNDKLKISLKVRTNSKKISPSSNNTKRESSQEIDQNTLLTESEDLGGFKLYFTTPQQFYIVSTLVGKVKLLNKIQKESVIEKKQKIAEVDILNIKYPVQLDFKIKILDILVEDNENVDYGKKLILAEIVEDTNGSS